MRVIGRNFIGLMVLFATLSVLITAPGCGSLFGGDDDDDDDPNQNAAQPIAMDLIWAIDADATNTQMTQFAARIREASDALWAASDGQAYIANVTLRDLSSDGDVILDNLAQQSATAAFAYTVRYTDGSWKIHMGGAYPMQAWIHEIGHAVVLQDWTLQEEYDLGTASNCAMGAYVISSGDGVAVYCDQSNCLTSRQGCWENVILSTHPDWHYPASHGAAPNTNITIENN